MRFSNKFLIILLLFSFVLSGCTLLPGPKVEPQNNNQNNQNNNSNNVNQGSGSSSGQSTSIEDKLASQKNIKEFSDYEELREFLEQGTYQDYSYGYGAMKSMRSIETSMPMVEMDMGMEFAENLAVGGVGDDGGGRDYSETNIQVEGVDEADIIKTDGDYIYAVTNRDLYIVKAYPTSEAEVVTKISFDSTPQNIFINGNVLAVFGRDDAIHNTEIYKSFKRRNSFTFLKVFDISDKKKPKQLRDMDFEGNYTNSRMIGSYVYFVTNTYGPFYYDDETPVPRIIENGEVVNAECASDEKCMIPDIYYFDMPYSSYNFTTVSAINIVNNEEDVTSDVYLLNAGQNMFVSQRNIYITYTKHVSEYELEMEVAKELIMPSLSERNQERVRSIEAVDNYILSPNEKRSKISAIIERYVNRLSDDEQEELQENLEAKMKEKYTSIADELEKTIIHKIAINKNNLDYKGNGEVKGQVLNQFSMDESDGYFRIATTKNRTWSRYTEESQESYSNLFVLDENLKEVGSIEGLAEGERIYSVRFMQNRAYMVTFKQMDPLFVIDLTHPTSPKVLGELKIPGYSDYLHPFNEDTLIGFGKDTGETEWGGVRTKGLKLSLFDVSDVSNPSEIDTYIMGDSGSDSIALRDHKAFLFSYDKELLSIPVSIQENLEGRYSGRLSFSGAAVFKVTKDGFELKGKIDHSDGGRAGTREDWYGYNYYNNTVKRSLYIDDTLYTFSSKYIKMNNISDLEEVDTIVLKKERNSSDDFEIIN